MIWETSSSQMAVSCQTQGLLTRPGAPWMLKRAMLSYTLLGTQVKSIVHPVLAITWMSILKCCCMMISLKTLHRHIGMDCRETLGE